LIDTPVEVYINESEKIFERMLWLNPTDNKGVHFIIYQVRDKKPWSKDYRFPLCKIFTTQEDTSDNYLLSISSSPGSQV